MTRVIKMNGVSWRRQRKEILTDINWEVAKGQHWAVIGLNGSGKTTLLNMVNGYIWPTTGEVTVLDSHLEKQIFVNCGSPLVGSVRRSKNESMDGNGQKIL